MATTNPIIYSWAKFFHGLIAAAISSAANGGLVMFVDPGHFNLEDGLGKLGALCAVSGIFGALTYLKDAKLPDFWYDPEKAR